MADETQEPDDAPVVVALHASRWAMAGAAALVAFAAFVAQMTLARSADGYRATWFSTAFLLLIAVPILAGGVLAWRRRCGSIAIGADGVRIVSPGFPVLELGHGAILEVDPPFTEDDDPLYIACGARSATLRLTLTQPVMITVPGSRPGHRDLTVERPYRALGLAPADPGRAQRALRFPPRAPLPPLPAPSRLARLLRTGGVPVSVQVLAALRKTVAAGATLLVVVAVAFGAWGFDWIRDQDPANDPEAKAAQKSDDTEGRSDLPPALPGYKGAFFRVMGPGGWPVYAWHVGRTVSVRVDSPAVVCGPWDVYWDANTSPDLPLGAGGRFHGTWRNRVYLNYGGYRDVTLTVAGWLAGDAVRVVFTRVDQYGGGGGTARCARSVSALARRVG